MMFRPHKAAALIHATWRWMTAPRCIGAGLRAWGVIGVLSAILTTSGVSAAPLVSLDYRIGGTRLAVSPASLSVPKNIAGSVLVEVTGVATNDPSLAGTYVEAVLRGPSFPARRLVGPVNSPLLLPPLPLVGDYQLDGLRLVDAGTGNTRLEGTPSSVPVKVFDEVLVSRVTSRALNLDEIRERGISVDERNFRTVEFEVGFVLEGRTIPVRLPVVAPTFQQSAEIIPAAELEARLAEAAAINGQIASTTELPRELETRGLNIQVQGINFQRVEGGEDTDLALRIPPIPAVMVIPGNIGFLNQFFSVQIFTENAAPAGSALVAKNIRAELKLPAGPDQIPAATYDAPGDDPLRFARVGPGKTILPVQAVVRPGPDGKVGTADDIVRLNPGESGQGEFLVEGLQEGLHVMDVDLTADLDGLAAGTVRIRGRAAGSVLVRNPKFSLSFSHPRTTRAGEPYVASVTVFNSGSTPANLVRVALRQASISGGVLESDETVELGTIQPGQAATANYRIRAQRTGAITFSNLTTGDDATAGQFRLTMGIDERGVALSPDSIAMPDFVGRLPGGLVAAATRVIGQALSAATAAQLPAGVLRVPRSVVTRRVMELAEAGQRRRYGDPLLRVLPDLLRDWQGGRVGDDGFDQILRETDAGREWREALFAAMEGADNLSGSDRLTERGADLAGLGQAFAVAATDSGALRLDFGGGSGATARTSNGTNALVYAGARGAWAVTSAPRTGHAVWQFTNAPATAAPAVAFVAADGTTRLWRWNVVSPAAASIYRFALDGSGTGLEVDLEGDGQFETRIPATPDELRELPPTLVAVEQDLTIQSGRPASGSCLPPDYAANYGTVLALLYSKPMTQAGAGNPASYRLDNGIVANSVKLQPDGRVALLNLKQGISAIRPRTLHVESVVDLRGAAVRDAIRAIDSRIPGTATLFREGVAVRGRVLRGDGTPASGVPVTLTYYDQSKNPQGECETFVVRAAQVFTEKDGGFTFDFVMAGIPYSVSATDTGGLPAEAVQVLLDSATGDELNRQKLLERLSGGASANSLLAAFLSTSLPQAVAVAEGLDRALIRDLIDVNSARRGQEVPMALQFRGRATVTGQVVASDGQTAVGNAAVNLFPDPDSRELGRGVLSDGQGRFAFFGVPLGLYTLDVRSPGAGGRTISGLLEVPGATTNLVVVLSTNVVETTSLAGRVYEADNVTPHAGARVVVGRFEPARNLAVDAVALVTADAGGNWSAPNIPRRAYDVVAISLDGRRKGVRRSVATLPGQASFVTVTLEDVTRVAGRVQFDDGRPAGGALVAGGESLVRTDASGYFELTGVPLGSRTISAGLERNPATGIDFPRLGSASLTVVGGANNFVLVKLRPAGRIFGKVLDANGRPVPSARVAIPQENGFLWTDADGQGNYVFENLGLGGYTLSAPANQVAALPDTSALLETIRTGRENEVLAAFGEAIKTFVGANDPYLNGQQQEYSPVTWGFTTGAIQFDGQGVVADIRMRPAGSISGRVLNHQGVPIGAKVRLTGLGPMPNGAPGTRIRGEMNSDPETGRFQFNGVLLAGTWALQAASPFYPVVIGASGTTTVLDPSVAGINLQFPAAREVNGRLAGSVAEPDGSPAGAGITVKISFSDDYQIQTIADGTFDTQLAVPAIDGSGRAISYRVEAVDPNTGRRGLASVAMTPGVTNRVGVRLLARDGVARIRVVRADGSPAARADVVVDQGTFPQEHFQGTTDDDGRVQFVNLFEGSYGAGAQFTEFNTRVGARTGFTVVAGGTNDLTLVLSGTGTIIGQFRKSDRTTPVAFAQVSIGNLGFASGDTDGRFRFDGVPPGTYRVTANDPVTGANGQAGVTLAGPNQTAVVNLYEAARGEINGLVVDSDGVSPVPRATVVLSVQDGLNADRTVTTGPDGRYSFPGTPAGGFRVVASHPTRFVGGSTISGERSGTLPEGTPSLTADIALEPLGILPVVVLAPDGKTPVVNAEVSLYMNYGNGVSASVTTDDAGRAAFIELPLRRTATVTAFSPIPPGHRSGAIALPTLTQIGSNPPVTLVVSGVGTLSGLVLASDGTTPVAGADVEYRSESTLFPGGFQLATTSDANGRFQLVDLPLGAYRISATRLGLAGAVNGRLSVAGQSDEPVLRLGDSGGIAGRLVRADGTTPVAGIEVLLQYASQSANPGRTVARADEQGRFAFENVPVGAFTLRADAPGIGGVLRESGRLDSNGQRLNLGDVRFDEAVPEVVGVSPPDTTQGVPVRSVIEVAFSEALDPATVTPVGFFVRLGQSIVPGALSLVADGGGIRRLLRFVPSEPLVSQRTYEVVVMSAEVAGPLGAVIGSGPSDRVGRFIAVPFVSRFTTRDDDPPQVVSIFPANREEQVDVRAVPRIVFSEPIRSGDAVMRLIGPDFQPVPGTVSASLNGLALSFTPTAALLPNSTYVLQASNLVDLAGNRHPAPSVGGTFATLDTLGPGIGSLAITGGRPPVAGTRVVVEALLAIAETGVTYRFTQDLAAVAPIPGTPQQVEVLLPMAGTTRVRVIATDRFGNDGPLAELAVAVQPNGIPSVALTRQAPPSGPVASGSTFTVGIGATDDDAVTRLSLVAIGAVSLSTNYPDGSARVLSIAVPDSAPVGASVRLIALATDGIGQRSEERVIEVPIRDGTAPQVAIVAPAAASLLDTAKGLELSVASADNSPTHQLQITLSGAVAVEKTVDVISGPGESVTNVVTLDLKGATRDGSPVLAVVRAVDAAGNSRFASRQFRLPDEVPPTLVAVSPPPLATGVEAQPRIALVFSETIDTNRVAAGAVQLLRDVDSVPVPCAIRFETNATVVVLVPEAPLAASTRYRILATRGVTDRAGNPLAAASSTTFDVGGFYVASPANGARLIEGQRAVLRGAFTESLGQDAVRFRVAGQVRVARPADQPVEWVVPTLAELESPALVIVAEALKSEAVLATARIDVTVVSAAVDSDGDGMPNGYEVANGLDPFVNDAAGDADLDGLVNADEFRAGTDPRNPDTDGDEIPDGTDPRPLVANHHPVAGTPDGGKALQFDGAGDYGSVSYNGASPLFHLSASLTFEAWVQASGPGPLIARQQCIFAWPSTEFELAGSGPNLSLQLRLGVGNDSGFATFTTPPIIPTNRWTHLAATFDAASHRVRLYVDGTESLAASFERGGVWQPGTPFWFGGIPAPSDGCWSSAGRFAMDEVRIWNTERTASELQAAMTVRLLPGTAGLVGNWRLDEGAGVSGVDASGMGNAMTLGNGTAETQPAWVASGATIFPTSSSTFLNTSVAITLTASDADPGDAVHLKVTSLPTHGTLFLTSDGVTPGEAISTVPMVVTSVPAKLIFTPATDFLGRDEFAYTANDGFVDALHPATVSLNVVKPQNLGRAPIVEPLSPEIVAGKDSRLAIVARDADGNLRQITVETIGGQPAWQRLGWETGGNPTYQFESEVPSGNAVLVVRSDLPGTASFIVRATDSDGLVGTRVISVMVLSDIDHDGIADRDDPDIDGDGLSNEAEVALGTDSQNADSDGDGRRDGVDPLPLLVNRPPLAAMSELRPVLVFDGGRGAALSAPAATELNPGSGSWTVSAWVQTTAVRAEPMTVAGRYECGQGNCAAVDGSAGSTWLLTLGTDGRVTFGVRGENDSGPPASASGGPDLRDGNLHHIAGVLDRTSSQLRVWVDGSFVGSGDISGISAIRDPVSRFAIGRQFVESFVSSQLPFEGVIRDVRVWSTARSVVQLNEEETASAPYAAAELLGYWPVNDGPGSIVADASGHGLNLSVQDGATWAPSNSQSGTLDRVVTLRGRDVDADAISMTIVELPTGGARLFQWDPNAGRGAPITAVPASIPGPANRVVLALPHGVSGSYYVRYRVNDGLLQSSAAVVALRAEALPRDDFDGDGLPDIYELANGLDAERNDAGEDPDADGLSNQEEMQAGTDPLRDDTDRDGASDGHELAAGSNPLAPDTDGDGLPDGSDPQPLQVVGGLVVGVPASVTLVEGGETNLLIQVNSPAGPLALLEYAPESNRPTFAAFGVPSFANTTSNGLGTAVLSLHPLQDAAGVHTVTVRAASRDGRSGTATVQITVVDNPGLAETHWKDPVNGDWFNPARWTAGVPGPGVVAVVDAPGTYSVALQGRIDAAGVVLASPSASFAVGAVEIDGPVEIRSGSWTQNPNSGGTFHKPVSNRGLLQLYSRDVGTVLGGEGFIENAGVIRSDPWGGSCCGYTHTSLPIHTTPEGRLLVIPGSQWLVDAGGSVALGGALELGGFLALPNDGAARNLLVMAGSRIVGGGTLRLQGDNQLKLAGDVITGIQVELLENSRVDGVGTLSLEGEHTLGGTYAGRVVVAPGATIHSAGMRILESGSLDIRPGARVEVLPNNSLRLDGPATNRGTILLYSRDVNTTISGGGTLENQGTIRSLPWGGSCCGYSRVELTVRTTPSSRIEIAPGSQWIWDSAELETVHGELLLQGTVSVFAGAVPREMRFAADSRLTGGGTLRVDPPNRIVFAGDHQPAVFLNARSDITVENAGLLVFADGQDLAGNYRGDFEFRAGTAGSASGANFAAGSSLLVRSNATLTINANSTLTMAGVLTNGGTLRMFSRDVNSGLVGTGVFENEGLIRVEPWGGSCCGFARFGIAVNVRNRGELKLDPGAQAQLVEGGIFNLEGAINNFGFIEVVDSGAPHPLSLLAGSVVDGNGVLRVSGENQLRVLGDVAMRCLLELNGASRVTGPGALRLLGGQTLNGRINARLALAAGSQFAIGNGIIESDGILEVEPGAVVTFNPNAQFQVDGAVRSSGQIRLYSRDVNTGFFGSGSLLNAGVILVSPWGGSCCGYGRLNLANTTTAAGRLTVEPGGQLLWEAGGRPTFEGILEVNGFAAVADSGPGRDLTLNAGSAVRGAGLLRIDGSNRLRVLADVRIDSQLQLSGASERVGDGTLTLGGGQVLSGTYDGPTDLAPNARISVSGATIRGTLSIPETAELVINANQALHVAGTVTNRGLIRLFSRDVGTVLDGPGTIRNLGVLQTDPTGGSCCGFADIRTTVEVGPTGRIRVLSGAQMRWLASGTFASAGAFSIDGYLGVENDGPAREMQWLDGSSITGAGVFRVQGDNRIILSGETVMAAHLQLFGNASTAGDGVLHLRGEQSLTGTYGTHTVIESDATVTFAGPSFNAPLLVQERAVTGIGGNQGLFINAPSTNRGIIHFYSRDVGTTLGGGGDGRLVNEGTIQVNPAGGSCCGWARIHLPVETSASGTLRVEAAGQLIQATGAAVSGGTLDVNGFLLFENGDPARELTLAAGATLKGKGQLRFDGANRLVVNGPVDVSVALLNLTDSSQLAGPGPIAIATGATLQINHSTSYPGSVDLAGVLLLNNAGAETIVSGTLTLESSGTLNNAGTLRVGNFVNLGGTLVGNAPTVIIGPSLNPSEVMRIVDIRPVASPAGVQPQSAASNTWQLKGTGVPGLRPIVEASVDFIHWTEVPALITETSPGNYSIRIERAETRHQFLRLRGN